MRKPISSAKVVREVREILERAERERIEFAEADAMSEQPVVINGCAECDVCADAIIKKCWICSKWFCRDCGGGCQVCGNDVCKLCSEKSIKISSPIGVYYPGEVCKTCVRDHELTERDLDGRLIVV